MSYLDDLRAKVSLDEDYLANSRSHCLPRAQQKQEIAAKWMRLGLCTDALEGESRIGVVDERIDPDSFHAGLKAFARIILGIEGLPYGLDGSVTR